NPAGLLFGAGTSLDVPASFHASTADQLRFNNDEVFDAQLRGATPTGDVAPQPPPSRPGDPPDLVFSQSNASPIRVEPDATLAVTNGASLFLIGSGNVAIAGSVSSDALEFESSLGRAGQIWIAGDNVTLSPGASASATGRNYGGAISLEGREVTLSAG